MTTVASPKAGCEWYAAMCGWSLSTGNVMVEGTSDVAYFALAARLHQAQSGASLLGTDLSIFAAGLDEEGGTYGISERFPTLFNLASLDRDPSGRRRFRVIALFDDDTMGRSAVKLIAGGHRQIREYESTFRLRRVMPRRSDSVKALTLQTETANSVFGRLECTIEDMLSDELCTRFVASRPEAVNRPASTGATGTHRYWTTSGKRMLRQFAEEQATIDDVRSLVDALCSLRSYVGLPPDGIEP
jgi:hypothetical protein